MKVFYVKLWNYIFLSFLDSDVCALKSLHVMCSILDQQQKQTVPFSGGRCMGEFDGRVFVATSRDVYYLLAVPVEKQVRIDILLLFELQSCLLQNIYFLTPHFVATNNSYNDVIW